LEQDETASRKKSGIPYIKNSEKIYDLLGMPEALRVIQKKTQSFSSTYCLLSKNGLQNGCKLKKNNFILG
jgi:hypothetical protein